MGGRQLAMVGQESRIRVRWGLKKIFSHYAIGCLHAPPVALPNRPVEIRFFVGVDPSGGPTKSASGNTIPAGGHTETLLTMQWKL